MKIAYRITLAVLFISTWVSTQGETSLPAKRKRVNFILFLSEPGECVKPGAREDNYLDTFNFQVQNNVKVKLRRFQSVNVLRFKKKKKKKGECEIRINAEKLFLALHFRVGRRDDPETNAERRKFSCLPARI